MSIDMKTLDYRIRAAAEKELRTEIGREFAALRDKWGGSGILLLVPTLDEKGYQTEYPARVKLTDALNACMAGYVQGNLHARQEAALANFINKVATLQEEIDELRSSVGGQ